MLIPIPTLQLTQATRELQARLRASADAAWRANPELFWINDNGTLRMGTRLDVHLEKQPWQRERT